MTMFGIARNRQLVGMVTMGLLSVLFGCAKDAGPFHKVQGVWHYRSTPIAEADAATFVALSDHYAKDKQRVFYADTYRKGQDYYLVKYDRIAVVEHADAASFSLLANGYARDTQRIYRDGYAIHVQDPASFEVLALGQFARDRHTGYFDAIPIAGSDGASFVAISDAYAKDRASVYYCQVLVTRTSASDVNATKLTDADPASFEALENNYARDAVHAYYRAQLIADQSKTLVVLGSGYAKTDTRVFYEGERLKEAIAASFVTTVDSAHGVLGDDGVHRYSLGQLLKGRP